MFEMGGVLVFDEIKEKVDKEISSLNMFVSRVYFSEEEGIKNLNVELDSDEVIDLDRITKASEVINPIIDKMNISENSYVLDIHSKEKGEVKDE